MEDRNENKAKFKFGDILHDRKFKTCFTYSLGYWGAVTFNFIGRYTLATGHQITHCVMEEPIKTSTKAWWMFISTYIIKIINYVNRRTKPKDGKKSQKIFGIIVINKYILLKGYVK